MSLFIVLIEWNKKKVYEWTEEVEIAFQDLKVFLNELPTLTASIPGKTLTMYLEASQKAIGSVLLAERDKVQKPIYFFNKILQDAQVNYPLLKKLVFTLLLSSRRRYFQAHPIHVLTDKALK